MEFISFSTPTKRLLYLYRHFLSSIPNLNYLWNSHRDSWYIRTTFLWRSFLVVTPTLWLPPRDMIQNRKYKLNNMGFYVLLRSVLFLYGLSWRWKESQHDLNFSKNCDGLCSVSILKNQSIKPIIILLLIPPLTPINMEFYLISPPSFTYFTSLIQ